MKYIQTPDKVIHTELDTGSALLDVETNTYFLLNKTGALVWDSMQEHRTLDQLCDTVASKFNVSEAECKADVQKLLLELLKKDLVVGIEEYVE